MYLACWVLSDWTLFGHWTILKIEVLCLCSAQGNHISTPCKRSFISLSVPVYDSDNLRPPLNHRNHPQSVLPILMSQGPSSPRTRRSWCGVTSVTSVLAGSFPSLVFRFHRNKMFLSCSLVYIQYCGEPL